jgi:hypothetical protein
MDATAQLAAQCLKRAENGMKREFQCWRLSWSLCRSFRCRVQHSSCWTRHCQQSCR